MADPPDVKAPSGTVKLFGQSVSKKTLMIGGLVGAGVLGYAWYRKSKNAAGSTSAAADATGATSGTDPVTGYPYGSPQDTAALAAQQDSGLDTNAGSDINPETGYPYDSAQDLAALGYTSTGGGAASTSAAAAATTVSQWEQECISNLEAGGVDAATISNAEAGLPRYLAHLSLSSAQATAVQLAVGLTGPPPGGGSYSIIPAAPAPAATAAGTVTVPNLHGMTIDDAGVKLASVGLVLHHNAATAKGTVYEIEGQTPGAGAKVSKGSTVDVEFKAR